MSWPSFLSSPVFVIPWYGFGIAAGLWAFWDSQTYNRLLNEPLKPGWLIITVFFGPIGVVLYLLSSRPPGIARMSPAAAQEAYHAFVKPRWKKVLAAAIHCVAGDGLGIMTAMVVGRRLRMTFWTEFGYEYLVGFVFGWLLFQIWAFHNMGHSFLTSLWKAGRAEFFSMMTVMTGMGLIMGLVTPTAGGMRPDRRRRRSGDSAPWGCWPASS